MEGIEKRMESVMDTHDVVVAILAPKKMPNSLEAREAFKEFACMILSSTSPALYAKGDVVCVYGVTAKMKNNPVYYQEFLDACLDCESLGGIEIYGITSEI